MQVRTLMLKLRSSNAAGKLRSLKCDITAIADCDTRWTGTYRLLHRWESIKFYVTDVDFPNLFQFLLTPEEKKTVPIIFKKLKYFNDIMIALQGKTFQFF